MEGPQPVAAVDIPAGAVPPALRASNSVQLGIDLSGVSDEQLHELFVEFIPGAAIPSQRDDMLWQVEREMSDQGINNLAEYDELIDDNVGADDELTHSAAPAPDRSAALARCDHAIDYSRVRLEANFVNVHGRDNGDDVIITKRKVEVCVLATTDDGRLAAGQQLQLDIGIAYENLLPVDEMANTANEPLFQVIGGARQPWLVDGKAKIEVKLNVLTSMRHAQKFCVVVHPADAGVRAAHAHLTCHTAAIKTMSKLPRRKALGTDAASRAARREQEQRAAQQRSLDDLLRSQHGAGTPLGGNAVGAAAPRPSAEPHGAPAGAAELESLASGSPAAATPLAAATTAAEKAELDRAELARRVAAQDEQIRSLTESNRAIMAELGALRRQQQQQQPPPLHG
ncbi:hypothetical protein KFE25_005167 [Diacronema lutheri]|uniref:Uncharacterized protein n=1 Tax=Diacronema lutheri TaxID=2081491 RepID=A0A8J5XCP6_DIALT|nr:hypothetical protein KFE25_005167 [Diacronema lutheri]